MKLLIDSKILLSVKNHVFVQTVTFVNHYISKFCMVVKRVSSVTICNCGIIWWIIEKLFSLVQLALGLFHPGLPYSFTYTAH